MRILSQDGTRDIPYEMFCLGITEDNCIVATQNLCESIEVFTKSVMAKYSTAKKAQKSLDMLREEYQRRKWEPTVIEDGEITEQQEWHYNEYFQFPADDEIEE